MNALTVFLLWVLAIVIFLRIWNAHWQSVNRREAEILDELTRDY